MPLATATGSIALPDDGAGATCCPAALALARAVAARWVLPDDARAGRYRLGDERGLRLVAGGATTWFCGHDESAGSPGRHTQVLRIYLLGEPSDALDWQADRDLREQVSAFVMPARHLEAAADLIGHGLRLERRRRRAANLRQALGSGR